MNLSKKLNAGFTIVEMLIYMGLMSILMVVMSNMFISILETQSESEAKSTLVSEAQFIQSRMRYDLNRATAITTPVAEGIVTDQLIFNTSGGEVQYAIGANETLVVSDGGTVFALHGDHLEATALEVVLHGNDSGNPSVEVDFTLKDRYTEDEAEYRVVTGLR